MKINTGLMLLCATLLVHTKLGVAQEPAVDVMIDKVVAAYGGDKLLSLKGFKLTDKRQEFRNGQNHSPNETDLFYRHASVTVDLVKQRKEFRLIRGTVPSGRIFDGQNGFSINPTARVLTKSARINFATADSKRLLHLDTALVLMLKDARESAEYVGERSHHGVMYDVVKFKTKQYPQLTLFIDKHSGRIAQMQRPYRKTQYYNTYFSEFTQNKGVTYAATTYQTKAGKPLSMTTSRKFEINPDLAKAFKLPKGYSKPKEGIDFSTMTALKIADNLYQAGRYGGFSIFYDAGEYFIAAGGYYELGQRFAKIKALGAPDKPLKYLVVSHHHDDHLSGMKEAADLGVNFITVKDNIDSIREAAKVELADERFTIVENEGEYANGEVKVLDFDNEHAKHNLMTYFSSEKLLFTADMFIARDVVGLPKGEQSHLALKQKLNQAGFDVEQFAAAHSSRLLTMGDLDETIASIVPEECPAHWAICEK